MPVIREQSRTFHHPRIEHPASQERAEPSWADLEERAW